jgi:cytochrome c5
MEGQVAYGGTLDGAVIYQNLCGACHTSGAGGAPNTKELWAPRIATGNELLIQHAIAGYQGQAGIMPAKGGNPALTDEQVKVTVEYIVSQFK